MAALKYHNATETVALATAAPHKTAAHHVGVRARRQMTITGRTNRIAPAKVNIDETTVNRAIPDDTVAPPPSVTAVHTPHRAAPTAGAPRRAGRSRFRLV